jgi:hypothetical protein
MVNEIQVGRVNAILTKLLSMKEGSPSPVLAPEVLPVVVLENDRPEYVFLGGGKLCAGGLEQAAVALERPFVQLFNPVGSGVLLVVHYAKFESTTTQQIQVGLSRTPATTNPAGAAGPRDLRGVAIGSLGVVGQMRSQTSTLAQPAFYLIYDHVHVNFEPGFLPFPIILDPGSGLLISGTTNATNMRASFAWTERALESSEQR